MKKGIIRLNGVFCGACTYTIEHAGRKQPGVEEVRVDVRKQLVKVDYKGTPEVLKKIVAIIETIGHDAEIIEEDKQ